MLLSKAINKIFRTTLIMFLILSIFTIINSNNEKVLRTNIEINNYEEIPKNEIYLLGDNGYLVKANIYLENYSIEEKAKKIIEYLKVNNNKIPKGLNGYINKDITVNKIILEEDNLKINFSKEFLNIENIDFTITGLVYTLTNLSNVNTIEILVDDKYIDNYSNKLNKEIGINKEYLINKRKDIKKVTIFYYDEINEVEYLTPITKYLNDEREKIEIIIDELANNTPDNLIGYLSDKTNLISYQEENNVMVLNFNNRFNSKDDEINNKKMTLIAESIFENYDLNMVLFQENGQKIDFIKKKE